MFRALFAKLRSSPPSVAVHMPELQAENSPLSVLSSEQNIRLYFHDQPIEQMDWSEVSLVALRIENDFLPCPCWYIGNLRHMLRIPQDAHNLAMFIERDLRAHLPGFSAQKALAVLQQASTAAKGTHYVWQAA